MKPAQPFPLVRRQGSGERRVADRVALDVEISLSSESNFFTGLTGDISAGGIFVSTYRACPVGSRVELEFTLPGGVIRTTGTVRWTRDGIEGTAPGVGISLDELTDAQQALVDAFCRERSPLYYEVDDPVP